MFSLKNDFREHREALGNQYVNAWHNEDAFRAHEALTVAMHEYARELTALPHPVIKARCFAFLVHTAPIYINPDDWFGIALEVPKLDPLLDIGSYYHRPIMDLNDLWKRELVLVLTSAEDNAFIQKTRNHLFNELYIDYNHSTPCWEDILSLGICGLADRARAYRERLSPLNAEQTAYFDGIDISLEGLLALLHRYEQALRERTEPKLVHMHRAISHLLISAPKNTYEALLLAWIYWFAQEQIEGIRVRTVGALDRLYYGFYLSDLEKGQLTREDAVELFTYFMNGFYAMRVLYQQPMYFGGVDEEGRAVANELSYIVLDAYNALSAPNPKLQFILSENTPDALALRVLETVRSGNSSISIINQQLAEKSLLRLGMSEEEARTFLMSGCWDYAIRNHEVKTVPIRVNLPKILEYTMTGGICLSTGETVCPSHGEDFPSFDALLEAYKAQWLYIQERAMSIVENWERYLAEISPANLYSSTMTDSLAQGVDGYAKGMKYNTTIFTVCGLATLIDSLCAIKKFVFDEKVISLGELVALLKNDWQGGEILRLKILRDTDKYGNGSALADSLMCSLVDFFAIHTNRRPNSRGGFWKLGMLSIDKNVRFGSLMCATPDGRRAREPLSKNLSPVIGMDRGGITTLLNSLTKMDFSHFPHAAILDLVLHPSAVSGEDGLRAFAGIVRTYFARGGHSIQFNIFSADTLMDAKAHPAQYRNLQVRVCGWNVYFVDLEEIQQNAFIREALHREGRDTQAQAYCGGASACR